MTTDSPTTLTRGGLLAAAQSVLELMASRIDGDSSLSYVRDIQRAWEVEIEFARNLSPSLAVAPLTARAFDELVHGVVALPENLIPDWVDLFARNVLDLVQVHPIATHTESAAAAPPVVRNEDPIEDWSGIGRRLSTLAPAA